MAILIDKSEKNKTLNIEGKELKVTHLDKVFWPDEGYTKGDLLNYYIMVSSYILPYLRGRPESLHRYPNGINGKNFYQKNMDSLTPEWMEITSIYSESEDRETNYMIVNDLPSLIFMINLGCIDVNPWLSRVNNLDKPDFLVIDLDPENIEFKYVAKAALAVKSVLDKLKIVGYPKTSGATGMHVYIPLGAKYTYDQSRKFAEIIVHLTHEKVSDFTSLERSPKDRQGKVYLDWLQNSYGQTLAAPYCVRPRLGATVSTPLEWDEIGDNLNPKDFTIKNICERLTGKGEVFKAALSNGITIENTLKI